MFKTSIKLSTIQSPNDLIELRLNIDIAKLVLEIVKKQCGIELFDDISGNNGNLPQNTAPESSSATYNKSQSKSSTFFQRVSVQLVTIITDLLHTWEKSQSSPYKSAVITYAEILSLIICRVGETMPVHDRRVYLGMESVLRVQTIIFPTTHDPDMKELKSLLFQIHSLLYN